MNSLSFDSLSLLAPSLHALLADPARYRQLLVQQPPQRRELPENLAPAELVHEPVRRADEGACALAGLWLWVDELERAHRIVQPLESPSAAFWHAIVHRREGDFSNSRYWYSRCAAHPVLQRRPPGEPSPHAGAALVDLVEDVIDLPGDDPRRLGAVEAQRLEWMLLMDHCLRSAVGR